MGILKIVFLVLWNSGSKNRFSSRILSSSIFYQLLKSGRHMVGTLVDLEPPPHGLSNKREMRGVPPFVNAFHDLLASLKWVWVTDKCHLYILCNCWMNYLSSIHVMAKNINKQNYHTKCEITQEAYVLYCILFFSFLWIQHL